MCSKIWEVLHKECLPFPSTPQDWLSIASGFEIQANFPNCIGAIDGKHIRITNPDHSGSLFSNYKKYFSIVLLAVCDSEYRYIYINVGSCGTDSDSNIFKNSTLFTKLQNGEINLPPPRSFPNTNDVPLPYVIIGDAAFGISNNVMRPYARTNMTHKKKIFNYRISRARRYIECTFGIMSNKFRIFHRPLNTALPLTIKIVKASCVLHNFIRDRDGFKQEHTLTVAGLQDIGTHNNHNIRSGDSLRDKFANYFISPEGKVPWQDTSIF